MHILSTSSSDMLPSEHGEETQKNPWNKILSVALLVTCSFTYGSYTIFVHLCEEDGKIPFSSASLVLMIETFKMLFSLLMLLKTDRSSMIVHSVSVKQSLPFAVPAVLYFINNNLAVHMQLHMDPASYQVLCNLKIASTALLYRFVIKRHLTSKQWLSMCLLTLAGMLNSYGGLQSRDTKTSTEIHITLTGLFMMLTYCAVSGLAGVYSELILKRHPKMSLHKQNIMMYTYGIIINFVAWFTQEKYIPDTESRFSLFRGYSYLTFIIIISQGCNGLIMSAIFKHASNITRLFVVSCSMLVTTLLTVIIFHTQLNLLFIASFVIVLGAMYLYHRN